MWAGGLLDAGNVADAEEIFRKAASMAKLENDQEAWQGAQLGTAAILLRSATYGKQLFDAMNVLEDLAAHPVTSEIAASAWMLIGHVWQAEREKVKAVDAYQHAFATATKPSAIADAARRFLDELGSEPESEVLANVAAGNVPARLRPDPRRHSRRVSVDVRLTRRSVEPRAAEDQRGSAGPEGDRAGDERVLPEVKVARHSRSQ
jgi:hypothetical protein